MLFIFRVLIISLCGCFIRTSVRNTPLDAHVSVCLQVLVCFSCLRKCRCMLLLWNVTCIYLFFISSLTLFSLAFAWHKAEVTCVCSSCSCVSKSWFFLCILILPSRLREDQMTQKRWMKTLQRVTAIHSRLSFRRPNKSQTLQGISVFLMPTRIRWRGRGGWKRWSESRSYILFPASWRRHDEHCKGLVCMTRPFLSS